MRNKYHPRICESHGMIFVNYMNVHYSPGDMLMLCPFCGKVNPDDHAYCLYCGATGLGTGIHSGKSAILPCLSDESGDGMYDITGQTDPSWAESGRSSSASADSQHTDHSLHVHNIENSDLESFGENELLVEKVTTHILPAATLSGEPLNDIPTLPPASMGHGDPPPPSQAAARPPSEAEKAYLVSSLGTSCEIVRKIGVGGMASVYLARETSLDRLVAVKVLSQMYQTDDELVRRFKREAKIAARLEHPNIVSIHRVGGDEHICWFVMNYIPGGTLSDRLKTSGILPIEDIVRWGTDMCAALAYAHARGVIHRDLKPDNILIDGNGRAIITDFGIASASGGTQLTRTGAVLGTPQYMSPDQACGRPLDTRSDIYSLGVILYRMSTGMLPFDSGDPLSIMYMHVNRRLVPPEMVNPLIPLWLSDIIRTCMEKRAEDRFNQVSDVHAALLNRSHHRTHSRIIEGFRDDAATIRRLFENAVRYLTHIPPFHHRRKPDEPAEPTIRVDLHRSFPGSRSRPGR